jgi:hypothetical protein
MKRLIDTLTVEQLERLSKSAQKEGDAIHQYYDAEILRRERKVVVPFEPTAAMLKRGAASACSLTEHGAYGVWRAMLDEALREG